MKPRYCGLNDLISAFATRDVCLVLPTLRHARHWKERLADLIIERHGVELVHIAHTSITSRRTGTTLRLWVPYEPEPTMPMDFEHLRRSFDLYTFYPTLVTT